MSQQLSAPARPLPSARITARRFLSILGALVLVALMTMPALAAHTVTVWSGAMDGWAITTSDGGTPPTTASATFVAGPGTPPLGTGSVQLSVGANGAGAAEIRNADYAGTSLADLTGLSYSAYVSVPGSGGQAPYIILAVDLDDDGASDDLLFFEPVYQDGTYSGDPVPDQGDVTTGAWQEWDAAAGGWWSLNAGTFGPPLVTLDSYVASNPDATLVNQSSGGGLRIVAGFGAGAWDNFVGNVDAVVVGTTAHTTTYDFEVAGVPTPTPTPSATPGDETSSPSPTPSDGASTLPDTSAPDATPFAAWLIAFGILAILVAAVSRRLRGQAT